MAQAWFLPLVMPGEAKDGKLGVSETGKPVPVWLVLERGVSGARELAPLVEYLPLKHRDSNLDHQHPSGEVAHARHLSYWEGGDRWIPGPAGKSVWPVSDVGVWGETLSRKSRVGSSRGGHRLQPLAIKNTPIQIPVARTCVYTHTHTLCVLLVLCVEARDSHR